MAKIGTYLQNALLNGTLRNTAYTPAATVYVGLHTADPTDTTATALANEVSGNAYARQSATFGSPSGGVSSITSDITFPQATPSGWGTVTHVTIWDASTTGNLLYHGTLSPSVSISASDQLKLLTGNLSVQLI